MSTMENAFNWNLKVKVITISGADTDEFFAKEFEEKTEGIEHFDKIETFFEKERNTFRFIIFYWQKNETT